MFSSNSLDLLPFEIVLDCIKRGESVKVHHLSNDWWADIQDIYEGTSVRPSAKEKAAGTDIRLLYIMYHYAGGSKLIKVPFESVGKIKIERWLDGPLIVTVPEAAERHE